jgi:PhnB protein
MDFITYLSFDGQCEAAFKAYEKIFGGKILIMARNADAPSGTPITPGSEDRIMHARLEAGGRLLMGGDAPLQFASKPQGFCVSFQTTSVSEAERVFAALANDGKIQVPIAPSFWAERFGMLIDKFGIPWMVNCEMRPTEAKSVPEKPVKKRA